MNKWPSLTMYSVPLVSTWSFAEEFRLLIDCGDGAASTLGGRIHKIDTIALTHAHRDHIGGLMQLLNLRGGGGNLTVVHPGGSGSFAALAEFLAQFDSETSGKVTWKPVQIGVPVEIRPGITLEAFETNHMQPSDLPRSIGYRVNRTTQKLKQEYLGLGEGIPALVKELGADKVFDTLASREIVFCGDGMPVNPADIDQAKCLVVETTFLDEGKANKDHVHVTLDQAFEMVTKVSPSQLILNHISARYKEAEIMERVESLDWPCSVKVVLPGTILRLP